MNSGTFTEWGPYISFGSNASKEVRIAWRTDRYYHTDWLKFGTTKACDNQIVRDWVEPTHEHTYILTDLNPDTTYYYQINRSSDKNKVYSFKTAPVPGSKTPFQFTLLSDIHANPTNPIKRDFDNMLEQSPNHDFNVVVGDSINDGNDETHWNSYFSDSQEYLSIKPQMNSTGNHDTDNEDKYCRFLKAWKHPFVNPQKGGYYLMEYANAVFFFVDSNNGGGWEPTPSDEQYEWLEENLEKFARQDRWIFIFMHHQIYSTGDFSCAHIMEEIYRPLCQEYHVDAVFYGHDHHYECFWTDRETSWGGTLYFVVGIGGMQRHIDHSIMGDRDGKTKYVWPGRVLNVRNSGVPVPAANISQHALGFRNDEVVGKDQLLGILEPGYVEISINGDDLELKVKGWHKEIYHHLQIKRAGAGRKFSESSEKVIYPEKK